MKVAILIRNLKQFGGGEKDVVVLTEGLNEAGITPDIFSEQEATSQEIENYFGKKINFKVRPFPRPSGNLSRVMAEIFLSHPLKTKLEDYDFVYDFTNKPPVYRRSKKYLKYIYIIDDKRVLEKSASRNFQSKLYRFLANLGFSKFNKISNDIINVTQSEYVQKEIKKSAGESVPIVYPPVEMDQQSIDSFERSNSVISLGRFSPEKNQLEQLQIAKKLPEINFIIIGIKDDQEYFNQIKKFKTENKVDNVSLIENASKQKVQELLRSSKVFLNTTKNEHFGLSTVEAIAAGCLPLAHKSGGQVEILENDEFLFETMDEAIIKLSILQKSSPDEYQNKIKSLQGKIEKYNEEGFKEKLLAYLK
ncbi:glycosyltransferase [Patescibacteria group bacterium]|nr:glycosyltransferase [Patescibacteria group bacterium]